MPRVLIIVILVIAIGVLIDYWVRLRPMLDADSRRRLELEAADRPDIVLDEIIKRNARSSFAMLTRGMELLGQLLALDEAYICMTVSQQSQARELRGSHDEALDKRKHLNPDKAIQENAVVDFRRLERLVRFLDDLLAADRSTSLNYIPTPYLRRRAQEFVDEFRRSNPELEGG